VDSTKRAAARALVDKNSAVGPHPSGRDVVNEGVSVEIETLIAKPVAPSSKTSKAPRQRAQWAGAAVKSEKLLCRYCGSDDLAPSFKKRRDARCRACFKKTLWVHRSGQAGHARAKTKAAK
jgi:hypothetical protein